MGFDKEGNLILFDFGSCKELRFKYQLSNGLYKLTSRRGTRRYMAPEVLLCKPYDLRADVYSFGLVLYEIFSLTQPFSSYGVKQHYNLVAMKNHRPHIPSHFPGWLRDLIVKCWSQHIPTRPDFKHNTSVLKNKVSGLLLD